MTVSSNNRKTKKNTKKLLSKLMGKSKKSGKKSASKTKKVAKKYVDRRPDLKIPTYRPTKFKIGTVKKGRDNRLWKVVSVKVGVMNIKKWVRATPMDVKCNNYLQSSIKQNITKYKSGNKSYKSLNQAIAIAYAMTKKKFPKCLLLNKK